MSALTRRRFLAIAAAAAAFPPRVALADAPPAAVWRGVALGARAEIRIDGVDPATAAEIIDRVRAEIDRLEGLFSLHRSDSAIVRLNKTGVLAAPDPDFLALMSTATAVHRATGGLFDPTVQPLWAAYAELAAGGRVGAEAFAAAAAEMRGRVGLDNLRVSTKRVAFARPGMALTLNGIAQGYITDRVADLIRAHGLRHVLVDVGEIRALDGRRDGSGWPVRIDGTSDSDGARRTVFLNDRALATSSSLGTTFDAAGQVGHILDPRTGVPVSRRRQITIEAPSATLADALSTALCLMSDKQAIATLETFPAAHLRAIA